ncbi:MAG: hypothetical protein RL557_942 [archaeon]
MLELVEYDEYKLLKDHEIGLVEIVADRFIDNDTSDNTRIVFQYHEERKAVGIFIRKEGKLELITDDEDLTSSQRVFMAALYDLMERKVDYERLQHQEWIEYRKDCNGQDQQKAEKNTAQKVQQSLPSSDDIPF